MNLGTFTKLTLCLALLISLAGCGSEKNDEKKPQDNQQVAQAGQPKPQDSKPETQNDDKKWLPLAMADIGLTAEQEAKIKPVVLDANIQIKALQDDATLDSAAKEEKLHLIGKAMFEQYKAILTPEQWTNFTEAREALMKKN